ncbi:sugar transferase [Arthrobacter glacialis]|uniref:sugar transferase n=1 Tax=Arthrobacter glacialis TaxID=1664 RepID=UPI000CD3E969|nr:sugar transferase [Arthrobacter glacialis]POH60673.1 polyprenyl glycosylphosphotransferase [Arthrobacter glacialis]
MSSENWRSNYARRIGFVDASVVVWAVVGAHLIRFGLDDNAHVAGAPYVIITVLLPCVWWMMLGAWGSREPRILGSGSEEYKRVFASALWLFGALAIVSYAFQMELARSYVGIAFPIGVLGLITGRWILRQHLGLERIKGRSTAHVLLVGGSRAAAHLIEALRRFPQSGYSPVGAYLQDTDNELFDGTLDFPVYRGQQDTADILAAVRASGADTVALTAGLHFSPVTMRQLGWELAASNIGLIVAPALTDIAGPRIHTQPVAGLPLIHVTTPKLEGGKRVAKRAFDITASSLLLAVFSPVMLIIAICIKTENPGPVFFRQERVGILGAPFIMHKFRSMVVDAEQQLTVLQEKNEGSGLLFKLKVDPRVTKVGATLRKFSLDELPQLLNVFLGTMSLVGPRPPLAVEVDAYEEHVRRRLLVKPGLTGLWQVSGRSNLSWQDSVRLDLYYVENWSLAGDLVILFRTAKAVIKRDGAY